MQQFAFQNKSGETLPAFGCGRLTEILETSAASKQPMYKLVKPDGEVGVYVVNGPNNVANNAYGVATSITDATLVLVDDGGSDGEPEFGKACGPTEDRWAATTDGTGLTACGEAQNKIIPVLVPRNAKPRCVILNGPLPAATNAKTGATSVLATVCEWSRALSRYTETEEEIPVFNHSESNDYAENTFGAAIEIDEHDWFFGDCGAMAARG